LVACVSIVTFASSAGVALASTTTSDARTSQDAHAHSVVAAVASAIDHRAAYDKLNAADKRLFDEAVTVAAVSMVPQSEARHDMAAAYTGCWGRGETYKATNVLGWTIFSVWTAAAVCVDNGVVQSVGWYPDRTGYSISNWALGWSKDEGPDATGLDLGWEGREVVQWKFSGPGIKGARQNLTPCIQIRLNANGYNYLDSTSCNIN